MSGGDTTMRFLQVRADKNSEAGVFPSKELVAAMGKFNGRELGRKHAG